MKDALSLRGGVPGLAGGDAANSPSGPIHRLDVESHEVGQ
jgi:hypothetical protein